MARQIRTQDQIDQVNADFDLFALPFEASLDVADRTVYGTTDPAVDLSMVNVRHLNNTRLFRGEWSATPTDGTIAVPYSVGQVVVSPTDFRLYKLNMIDNAGTDPGVTDTGWVQVGGAGLQINDDMDIERINFNAGLNQVTDTTDPTITTIKNVALDLAVNTNPNQDNAAELITTGTEAEQGLYVPVQQWARTAETDAANVIPLAKLPNLQLGNTYTYTSATAAEANVAGTAVGHAAQVEWHTGDLLVITSADTENAGIYVYISANQDPAGPVVLADNFRAVVSTNGSIQTTFSTVGQDVDITNQQLRNITFNSTTDNLTFTTSADTPVTVNVPQVELVSSDVTATNLFRRIKLGQDVYAFGDPAPIPTLGFSAVGQANRYTFQSQTVRLGFAPSAGTLTNIDTPTIDGPGNTAIIDNNGAFVATIAAAQGSTPAAWRITGEADITVVTEDVAVTTRNVTATGSISLNDARRNPTISNQTSSRSSLDQSPPASHTITFAGTGNINAGTAYDSNTYAISRGAATRVNNNTFITPNSNTTSSSTISFSTTGNRQNNQVGNPGDQTVTVTRFNPWFIGTASAAPRSNDDLRAATNIAQQGNTISNRTNFPVTGTVGDDIFLIATGINSVVLTVTVNGAPTSASTAGLPITTFEIPAAVGTITYTVYQLAGLDRSPTTFNINIT